MGTVQKIITITILVLFCLTFTVVSIILYSASKMDAASRAYLENNIHPIIDTWSADELNKRESAKFRDTASEPDVEKVFATYRKLGALKNYEGCTGGARMHVTPTGFEVTATYTGAATFENGRAGIKVSLVHEGGEWKILGFRVNSPLFGSTYAAAAP